MPESSRSLLQRLEIAPCAGLLPEHEQKLANAGHDLASLNSEAEALHDALFSTEEIARLVLGANYGRLTASMKRCTSAVAAIAPARVVDLGGGCGIVCFEAAQLSPESTFYVVDRSRSALAIGELWASRLGLSNVSFVRVEFGASDLGRVLGTDYDLVVLEYVFDAAPLHGDETQAVSEMTPAFTSAVSRLRERAVVQVRFGNFCEVGISALVRAAFRVGLLVDLIELARDGCTLRFTRSQEPERTEDSEVSQALESLSSQYWAQDDE